MSSSAPLEPSDQGRDSSAPDRTLKRLLRKPAITQYLTNEAKRLGSDHSITDATGAPLIGKAAQIVGRGKEITVGDRVVGRVYGPEAPALAKLLQLLAIQDADIRALAGESLNRYKELTMLYSISEKIIGAPDPVSIAQLISQEAERFLHCDGVAVLLLNPETKRLELASTHGASFLDRSTREVGNDIVGSVLETGVGEIVNDVEADPRSLATTKPLSSVVCSPLKSNERVFGMLLAGSEAYRQFNASDLNILNAIAAHAAAAIEVARLDRDLKAVSRKPVDLIYAVDERPPIGVSLLLGLQHVLIAVMSLAYPVLVTLEAGGSRLTAASVVSMSLIAMAIATVLQISRRGAIGSGFLAPYITSAIYLGPSLLAARIGGLGLVFGMTMLAGVFALALSQLLRRFRKLFPPEVSGVVVLMVGLSMVPIALSHFLGIGGEDKLSEPREWLVGIVTLATILTVTVLPIGQIRLYATAVGIGIGYLAAAISGLFDKAMFEPVGDLPMIGLQPFDFKGLSIEPLLIIPFVAAALASNIKDAGLVISCQKANDARWKRPDTGSMSGGLIAGGLGNIFSGALGGVGLGISAGSVGLAVATGTTARVIGLVTAAIFIVLAFLPKVTAVMALIPSPVMGAGLIYVACHLISSGIELIASRMLDARRIYVIGLPLLAGVGLIAVPDLFSGVPPWAQTVVSSPLAMSTILALALNLILNVGVSRLAQTRIALDNELNDAVWRFLERHGASWGARSDVIQRAAPAIIEWCEELREIAHATHVSIDIQFDEFQLVATLRTSPQDGSQEADDDAISGSSLEQIARTIAQRYECRAKRISHQVIVFNFEH